MKSKDSERLLISEKGCRSRKKWRGCEERNEIDFECETSEVMSGERRFKNRGSRK